MTTTDVSDQVLQAEISRRTAQGWQLISKSGDEAQMRKPKSFSMGWALVWLLALGIGLLFYLIYYAAKKDKLVYIRIVDGQLIVTES